MTDDLRDIARELRREPDSLMLDRVRRGVRVRIAVPPSPLEILAGWLRPMAISLAAIVVLFFALFLFVPDPVSPDAMADLASRTLVEQEVSLGER